jgi:3'(2'), 5'-bisphosphate nucleotidase
MKPSQKNDAVVYKTLRDGIIAAKNAGREILEVYNSDFTVEQKKDNSPLTVADRRSHTMISEYLLPRYPEIPILSEEGTGIPFKKRKRWGFFWLVDPLDGTKEFIKRNGEFTVNLALVNENKPVLGVVYVPVTDVLYFGALNFGSYKLTGTAVMSSHNGSGEESSHEDALRLLIQGSSKLPTHIRGSQREVRIIGSRSHLDEDTQEYISKLESKYDSVDIVFAGSSMKICQVAEGVVDVYPRFGPTMEWDTAAGQAITEFAGGSLLDFHTRRALTYNKKNLVNPWFIVTRSLEFLL